MEKASPHLAKRSLETVSKGPILRRMDALSKNRAVMEKALRDLENQTEASLLDLGILHRYVESTGEEAGHLRQHWFDAESGWWKELPAVEPVLREALIQAGRLALEHDLPVDSYWVAGGAQFEVAVCKSDRQITMLVISPFAPLSQGGAGPSGEAGIWMFKATR